VRELETLDLLNDAIVRALLGERDRAVRALLQVIVANDRSGRAVFAAGVLLLNMHEADGTTGVAHALRRADEDGARGMLAHLSAIDWTLPIRGDEVVDALGALLRAGDRQAIGVCSRFGWVSAEPFFAAMLDDSSVERRADAVAYFAKRAVEPRAIEVARQILLARDRASIERAYWLGVELTRFIDGGSPNIRARAAAVLREFVLDVRVDDDPDRVNAASTVLGDLGAALAPDAAQLLVELSRDDRPTQLRGSAVYRLAEHAPEMARAIAAEMLPHGEFRPWSFAVIEKTGRATRDEELADRVYRAIGDDAPLDTVRAAIEALIAIDAPSRAEKVRALSARLSPDDTLKARWVLEGITPASALECLRRHGVFSEEEVRSLPRKRVDESDVEPVMWLFGVFYELGRGAYLSTDIYMTPWPFNESVTSLANATNGVLAAESVSQEVETEGTYVVRFIVRERVYVAHAPDWEMQRAIVAQINNALSDIGDERRFIGLAPSEGLFYVFAEPLSLQNAVAELGVALPVN